jgi:glycosyltransferase involved in cell wall biosynthesis
MARLNFVLPFFPTKPVGGAKIMYQFANGLAAKGHDITIIHTIRRPHKKQRTPVWLRLLITKWRARNVRWFQFLPAVKVIIVPEISNKHVPVADCTICTWWQMAYAIQCLDSSKGRKCNLIQDYELWTGQEELVHRSYSLPMRHIVIAEYLRDLVSKYNRLPPEKINLPVDASKFKVTASVEARDPLSLIMMYSEEPRKGSLYGIEALTRVKEKFPETKATLFSVYQRPADLPSWIDFVTRPANLPDLYNRHAIFVSPSLGEGWALPPPESMLCGCAVVCTNIGGHQDYAHDQVTALLVDVKDPAMMAEKVESLVRDQAARVRLAKAGCENIRTKFTWEKAIDDMEGVLLGAKSERLS